MFGKPAKLENKGCYLITALFAAIWIAIITFFVPNAIPFTSFQFWHLSISIADLLAFAAPAFVWGCGVTAIGVLISGYHDGHPELSFAVNGFFSLVAGVFEEVSFRWLIFYSAIIGAQISNWIFFGFVGHGLIEWVFNSIEAPIANFFTLGLLSSVLLNQAAWFVGAAVVNANSDFQKGHEYLGPFGLLNSWFMGMFFFYLMFQYGIIAAIIVHFVYDFAIDSTVYLLTVRR